MAVDIRPYADIHHHSNVSSDGFQHPSHAAPYAVELGYIGLGTTQHGNMYDVVYHYQACRKHGLIPVIGIEAYHQPTETVVKSETWPHHLTLLAMNNNGLQNLYRVVTTANAKENFHRVPIVAMDTLFAHSDDVIVLSGCISGYLASLLIAGKMDDARTYCKLMRKHFGDRFYLEIMPYPCYARENDTTDGDVLADSAAAELMGKTVAPDNFDTASARAAALILDDDLEPSVVAKEDLQRIVNLGCLELASELNIELVMTSDSHYVRPTDHEAFKINYAMRKRGRIGKMADYSMRYMPRREQMEVAWDMQMGDYQGAYAIGDRALNNTAVIAHRCAGVTLPDTLDMPDMEWIQGDHNKALRKIVREALEAGGHYVEGDPYLQRAVYELDIIKHNKYINYFLLCHTLINFCNKRNITIAARGSGVASLVLYLMGGSKVDPIKAKLLLDRFMDMEGVHEPDVDFDVEDNRRGEVVEYVKSLFGGNAYPISTYMRWGTKAIVLAFKTVYQMQAADVELFSSTLLDMDLDERPFTLAQLLADDTLAFFNDKYQGIVECFASIHGGINAFGRHAAGIAITRGDHTRYFPMVLMGGVEKGQQQAGLDMTSLEAMHLTKLDVLGVAYLSGVKYALSDAGVTYDDAWLADEAVFDMISKGHCRTLFQLDSPMARQLCRELGPSSFADIALLCALNRPPALPISKLLLKAKATGKVDTGSLLYPYCKDTYGFVVYQEQVMQVCRQLAGLDSGAINRILKMLKRRGNIQELCQMFVDGCKAHGVTEKVALGIWNSIRLYSFNEAHADAYAWWAIVGGYLKRYHKYSWYAGILRSEEGADKAEPRRQHVADAVRAGCNVCIPHVNHGALYSHMRGRDMMAFPLDWRDENAEVDFIQEGLTNLPGIGMNTALAIQEEADNNGPYQSEADFYKRWDKKKKVVNSKALGVLKQYGALNFDVSSLEDQIETYLKDLARRAS